MPQKMPVIDPEQIKAESIKTIRSWDLLTIDHLPTLEAEDEFSPQSAPDVARRCLGDRRHAVCVLDAKGEVLKQESVFTSINIQDSARSFRLGLRCCSR